MEQGASSVPSVDNIITDLRKLLRILNLLNKKSHICKVCKITFGKVAELVDHEKKHHMRPFRCNECKITCQSRIAYLEHLYKVHERACYFSCPHCFKNYEWYRNYSNHLKGHVSFECGICHKKFSELRVVYNHCAIEHLDIIGKLDDVEEYIQEISSEQHPILRICEE